MAIEKTLGELQFKQVLEEQIIPYYNWHYIIKPFLIRKAIIYSSILINGVILIKLAGYLLAA